MSDKETTRNETPWRARGFKKPFSGTKNFTYQEFVDANKSSGKCRGPEMNGERTFVRIKSERPNQI